MTSNSEFELIAPEASSVVESMRSIGYNLETALSDIIDNSISAQAAEIKINFHWDNNNSYIRIEDNGIGMSKMELTQAMKIGSKNPLAQRESKDLGRFGMGLKTAAFSQCRRLTVKSRRYSGCSNTRCWDLDTIRKTGKWTLLTNTKDEKSSVNLSEFSYKSAGTIVLLERLDRVISLPYSSRKYNAFLSKIDKVEKHLRMVFHRYLSGPNSINIIINNHPIEAWDPYLLKQDATQELLEEPFQDEDQVVKVAAYILPHHSKVSEEVYKNAEGPKGWNGQQGFYIYRNKRLLVAGSWLGLFKKEEPYKLARVMVDITSNSDFNWQIDIKKSVARPPNKILQELKRIGNLARQASYRVFYHRGTKIIGSGSNTIKESHLWEQVYRHGKSFYKLNKSHPLLLKLIEDTSVDERILYTYLSLVEENLPINLVPYQPSKENNVEVNKKKIINDDEKARVLRGLSDFIYTMRQLNYTEEDILFKLRNSEPYKHYPELIDARLDE
ncbi:ATP-binding protein [Gracilibacillus suaedae]|uniref:ATP-binding protein n=1 Tax=Gracilibacillus suaedae TaxID=2820273 RepID=UPI001ABEA0BD|nr:ATP-binding protein [Gracilibacillus suaedae]